MTSLDEQLDQFAEKPVEEPVAEPAAKPKRERKHVGAFSLDQEPPEMVPPPDHKVTAPHVYTAICAVTAGLAREGIGKTRKNLQQGYAFRGIDDIYNSLAALLVAHKLVILPHVEERTVSERATRGGGILNYVTLRMSFQLASAVDGSMVQVSSFGEAMDSGDKATNKALSTAYKYMAMQVFCIPTIGHDPEEDTYELVARNGGGTVTTAPARPQPAAPPMEPVSDLDDELPMEVSADDAQAIVRTAVERAGRGWEVFRPWYLTTLTDGARLVLRPHMPQLKAICAEADKVAKAKRKGGTA